MLKKQMTRLSILLFIAFLLGQNCFTQTTDTIKFNSVVLDSNGLLKWSIAYNTGGLKGQIEQFRWNKWVKVNSFESQSLFKTNLLMNDSTKVTFHFGLNKFRIKITAPTEVTSKEMEYYNKNSPDCCDPGILTAGKELLLDTDANYEIYDKFGRLVLKGKSNKVNVTSLTKDVYYLVTDKKTTEFIKK
jgi:hypothetical protein